MKVIVHCSSKVIRIAVYQNGELMAIIDLPPWCSMMA